MSEPTPYPDPVSQAADLARAAAVFERWAASVFERVRDSKPLAAWEQRAAATLMQQWGILDRLGAEPAFNVPGPDQAESLLDLDAWDCYVGGLLRAEGTPSAEGQWAVLQHVIERARRTGVLCYPGAESAFRIIIGNPSEWYISEWETEPGAEDQSEEP